MKVLKFETMEAAMAAMDHADNPEWENVAEGETIFELPDGSKWARVRPRGFTEYDSRYKPFLIRHEENERRRFIQAHAHHLLTEQRAKGLDRFLDQACRDGCYDRMASIEEALPIHDIFVNIGAFEPTRFFCAECDGYEGPGSGWFDPTLDDYHPREDDPLAEDPPIIAPATKLLQ